MAQQKSKSERESAKADIIKLLKDEQKKVKQLFQEFESLYDPSENLTDQKRESRKAAIVSELCVELANYAQAEEKIFFPAVREAIALQGDLEEKQFLDEIAVEHAGVQILLAQLVGMKPSDSYYDARVRVLRRYTKHHVKVLKGKIFSIIKDTKLDMRTLGEEMSKFKDELSAKKKRPPGSSRKITTAKK